MGLAFSATSSGITGAEVAMFKAWPFRTAETGSRKDMIRRPGDTVAVQFVHTAAPDPMICCANAGAAAPFDANYFYVV